MRPILLLAFLIFLAGCTHTRDLVSADCRLPAYRLLPSTNFPKLIESADPASFEVRIQQIIAENKESKRVGGDPVSILALSGGSQHGAFGAGLFLGMPSVPNYDIVTGVSTGALLSIPIFLTDQPPAGRNYPAYMRTTDPLGTVGERQTVDIARAYAVPHERYLLDVYPGREVAAPFKGSVGNFDPLRRLLRVMISPETVDQLAKAHASDRHLFFGVTSLDDGYGYAIDVTAAAATASAAGKQTEAGRCLTEALLASSTVPPGVPPISLKLQLPGEPARDHLTIDGGARYAVFVEQVVPAIAATEEVNLDIVVNGKMFGDPWLKKDGTPVADWSVVNVAMRAVDILQNQVARLSISVAERWASAKGRLRIAFIGNDGLTKIVTPPLEHNLTFNDDTKTCSAWKTYDAASLHPFEFYPHYMRCMMDYGAERGAKEPWNLVKP